MDTRRHAPLGRVRPRLVPSSTRSRPHAYLGRTGRPLAEIYVSDHADSRRGGRFRWLLSTCLAGAVGALAILVAIAGSVDTQEGASNLITGIEDRIRNAPIALRLPTARVNGLRWAVPKTDKLVIPTGAVATTSYIPDRIKQRRGNREYLHNKYYIRLAAPLTPVSKAQAQLVPAFDPMRLYGNEPLDENDRPDGSPDAEVVLKELNGIIASEDGQELEAQEVAALVARAQAAEEASATSAGELLAERAQRTAEAPAPQTTILRKTTLEGEDTAADDSAGRTIAPIKVQRGDTLARIIARVGAYSQQVRAMIEAARPVIPETAVVAGYEVRAIVMPSPARPSGEVVRFSVFDESGVHKVTVTRSASGEYVASPAPTDERIASILGEGDRVQDNSLYSSLHHTAAKQGVPDDLIMQIMRIHVYDTDFRQPVRVGDGLELFFDMKGEDKGIEGQMGDLLATFVTAGGQTNKFYRFITSDGTTDFYDPDGSTSRKFLERRPVRGENVRLTSGYGWRRHPLLGTSRMHTGVDWATAHGTPILAAGNGVVEEVGAKGEYGNYVRIRHANGYKTAYGHMSRYGPGITPGIRVRQGQIIGYVGSTGVSSGPHVHFEVQVNGQFVNPEKIQVPNDKQLSGKELADFKREKSRIDDLMRRPPVSTKVVTAGLR